MKFVAHPLSPPEVARQLRHIKPDAALIARLQQNLQHLRSKADALTTTFYANLFTAYPVLRGMFPDDLSDQRRKLFDSLDFVVTHLDRPSDVRPVLAELGKRHVSYGARPEHYPIVRDTLVGAMRAVAGKDWSTEIESDWHVAIELIGSAMQAPVSP